MDRPECVVGVIRGVVGRAASRGVPQPPCATLSQSEPIQIFPEKHFFPEIFWVEPALIVPKKTFLQKISGSLPAQIFPFFLKHIYSKIFELILLWFPPIHLFPNSIRFGRSGSVGASRRGAKKGELGDWRPICLPFQSKSDGVGSIQIFGKNRGFCRLHANPEKKWNWTTFFRFFLVFLFFQIRPAQSEFTEIDWFIRINPARKTFCSPGRY